MNRKEKAIANCGKQDRWETDKTAQRVNRKNYCGYTNDCPICRGHEKYRRSNAIKETFDNAVELFRAEIDEETDWRRLQAKLNRNDINAFRISLDDGTCVVVADKDPSLKGIEFKEISSREATSELTQDEYLFTKKRRGSTGEWSVSSSTKNNEEASGITIKIFNPVFISPEQNTFVPYFYLNLLVKKANTWSGGEITLDNAQDFMTHNGSILVEIALALGYIWNMEETRVINRYVTQDDIKRWKVKNIKTNAEIEYFGLDINDNKYTEKTFYSENDKLLKIIDGIFYPIPNHLETVELFKQTSEINEAEILEMADFYLSSPNKFGVFYDEDMIPLVEKYIANQKEKEKPSLLDSDIPF